MEKKKTNTHTTKVKPKKKTTTKKIIINKKKPQKIAFTLIELLAVIIILGVLMIIAIPSVTKYISDSRKNSYISTARQLISGARNMVNKGELGMYDTDATYYLPSSCIKTENGGDSPYGKFTQAYIGVTYDGKGYNYYWISVDEAGQGVKSITPVDKLDIDLIESDIDSTEIESIVNTTGIDGRSKLLILNSDCKNWSEEKNATSQVGSDGEEVKVGLEVGSYFTLVPDESTYVVSKNDTGYSSNVTINLKELNLWRVIAKNQDGTIDAVSEYVSSAGVIFIGAKGYANFVNVLQTIASHYMVNGYTKSVRIIGYDGQTLVINPTTAFDGSVKTPPSTVTTFTTITGTGQEYGNGVLGDTLYLKDYQLVKNVYGNLSAKKVGSTSESYYWFASRYYYYRDNNYFRFDGRAINPSGEFCGNTNLRSFSNGSWYNLSGNDYSIRPIITLNNGIQVESGSGTKDEPYSLKK